MTHDPTRRRVWCHCKSRRVLVDSRGYRTTSGWKQEGRGHSLLTSSAVYCPSPHFLPPRDARHESSGREITDGYAASSASSASAPGGNWREVLYTDRRGNSGRGGRDEANVGGWSGAHTDESQSEALPTSRVVAEIYSPLLTAAYVITWYPRGQSARVITSSQLTVS